MDLVVEEDVAGFLGVLIQCDEATGAVTLAQEHLTSRIIEALDIDHLDHADTPAEEVLVSDIKTANPPKASTATNLSLACSSVCLATVAQTLPWLSPKSPTSPTRRL